VTLLPAARAQARASTAASAVASSPEILPLDGVANAPRLALAPDPLVGRGRTGAGPSLVGRRRTGAGPSPVDWVSSPAALGPPPGDEPPWHGAWHDSPASSISTSATSWKSRGLNAGSLARSWWMRLAKASGISATSSAIGCGASCTSRWTVKNGVSARNGDTPVSAS
jgi:hypothetical protein